jgi:hypothetical protein
MSPLRPAQSRPGLQQDDLEKIALFNAVEVSCGPSVSKRTSTIPTDLALLGSTNFTHCQWAQSLPCSIAALSSCLPVSPFLIAFLGLFSFHSTASCGGYQFGILLKFTGIRNITRVGVKATSTASEVL